MRRSDASGSLGVAPGGGGGGKTWMWRGLFCRGVVSQSSLGRGESWCEASRTCFPTTEIQVMRETIGGGCIMEVLSWWDITLLL